MKLGYQNISELVPQSWSFKKRYHIICCLSYLLSYSQYGVLIVFYKKARLISLQRQLLLKGINISILLYTCCQQKNTQECPQFQIQEAKRIIPLPSPLMHTQYKYALQLFLLLFLCVSQRGEGQKTRLTKKNKRSRNSHLLSASFYFRSISYVV